MAIRSKKGSWCLWNARNYSSSHILYKFFQNFGRGFAPSPFPISNSLWPKLRRPITTSTTVFPSTRYDWGTKQYCGGGEEEEEHHHHLYIYLYYYLLFTSMSVYIYICNRFWLVKPLVFDCVTFGFWLGNLCFYLRNLWFLFAEPLVFYQQDHCNFVYPCLNNFAQKNILLVLMKWKPALIYGFLKSSSTAKKLTPQRYCIQ